MEVNPAEHGVVVVRLEPREVRRLQVALQRAVFEDVPPHHVGPALDFADRLLKALESLPRLEPGSDAGGDTPEGPV
jgi:hypothetical protein